MSFVQVLDYLREMNLASLVLRSIMAAVFGGLIGATRGRGQHAAGLRTHMLVCIGSASVMMVSQFFIVNMSMPGDIVRMPAQVVSGIGFLGAGSIIINGKNQVSGLTTAAGLWATACMGLACGAGYYEGATVMFLLIYVALVALQKLDTTRVKTCRIFTVFIELEGTARLSGLLAGLSERGLEIRAIEPFGRPGMDYVSYRVELEMLKPEVGYAELIPLVASIPGVTFAEELKI
jgi:putative Mg2+ transporter-C (MgtC) family protein